MNILLCVTGSVAAKVTDKTLKALKKVGEVKVVATDNAFKFMPELDERVYKDQDEWDEYEQNGMVLHIDLKDWADVIVFAPLSANTLAKISVGICDNLVTSIFRAWPIKKKIVLAPAMNTDMWNNCITFGNLKDVRLRYTNVEIVKPIEKKLVCGTTGIGAMANVDEIAAKLKNN